MNDSKSCPQYGLNSRGIASLTNEGARPVFIKGFEFGSFLTVQDLETGLLYRIHQTQFMPTQNIPAKFRESVFISLAHVWQVALTNYPRETIVSCGNLSVETMARKIRESRVGKNTYGWLSSLINEVEWKEKSQLITVEPIKDGVMLCGKHYKKEKSRKPLEVNVTESITVAPTYLVHKSQDELEKFCKLVEERMFQPMPVFVLRGFSQEQATDLESRYDIGFCPFQNSETEWQVVV